MIPRSHAPAWECIPGSTLTAPKNEAVLGRLLKAKAFPQSQVQPAFYQQTQRNALHIGVINNLKNRVRVAGVPSVDTNRALIFLKLYQSMCFDNLINSWFMSSLFSRRAP